MDRLEVFTTNGTFLRVNIPLINVADNGKKYVSYAEEQEKTEDERARARHNVGITDEMYESIAESDEKFVSYKGEQSNTDDERAQARRNVGITDSMYEFIKKGGGDTPVVTGDIEVDELTMKKRLNPETGNNVIYSVDSLLDDENGITVMGTNVGNLHSGDRIECGSTIWDVIRRIVTNVIDVVATTPSVTLRSSSSVGTVELGSSLTQTLSVSYADGYFSGASGYSYRLNAGCAQGATVFKRNGAVVDATNTTVFDVVGGFSFSSVTAYGASTAVPKKNDGTDSSVRISAGDAVSNVITVTASKKIFYGNATALPADNAAVRALGSKWSAAGGINLPNIGSGFVVVLPTERSLTVAVTGNNQYLYPDSDFTRGTVTVVYANGAIEVYNAYLFKPATAMDTNVVITIG